MPVRRSSIIFRVFLFRINQQSIRLYMTFTTIFIISKGFQTEIFATPFNCLIARRMSFSMLNCQAKQPIADLMLVLLLLYSYSFFVICTSLLPHKVMNNFPLCKGFFAEFAKNVTFRYRNSLKTKQKTTALCSGNLTNQEKTPTHSWLLDRRVKMSRSKGHFGFGG